MPSPKIVRVRLRLPGSVAAWSAGWKQVQTREGSGKMATRTAPVGKTGTDVAWALARNIVSVGYDDIPPADQEAAKKNIIDTLACILTGYQDVTSRAVVDIVVERGGKEEATILGLGKRAPADSAALANGTLARAFDFDDCHEGSATHASVSSVPAAVAMAERQGGVTGKQLIAAVALANDLIARLSLAACTGPGPGGNGFAPSMLYGTFGATAAAGKILGLNEAQMVDAMSIAMTRTAGSMQYTVDNGAYQINFGFLGQVGIMAALMAQRGVYFTRQVFQGKQGLFNLYKGGDYKENELIADLGKRFEGSNVSIKPYPSCKHTHTTISTALEAAAKFGLREDNIKEIEVRTNHAAAGMSRTEIRFDPNNRYEARAGIEKLVATAIIKGSITMDDMIGKTQDDPALFPRISRLAQKVRTQADPVLAEQYAHGAVSPAIINIRTTDGRQLTHRVDFVKGHPKNPMSLEECLDKFRACAPYAAAPLPGKRMEEIIKVFRRLEELEDTRQLVKLFG